MVDTSGQEMENEPEHAKKAINILSSFFSEVDPLYLVSLSPEQFHFLSLFFSIDRATLESKFLDIYSKASRGIYLDPDNLNGFKIEYLNVGYEKSDSIFVFKLGLSLVVNTSELEEIQKEEVLKASISIKMDLDQQDIYAISLVTEVIEPNLPFWEIDRFDMRPIENNELLVCVLPNEFTEIDFVNGIKPFLGEATSYSFKKDREINTVHTSSTKEFFISWIDRIFRQPYTESKQLVYLISPVGREFNIGEEL